jgi:hypothetical protein
MANLLTDHERRYISQREDPGLSGVNVDPGRSLTTLSSDPDFAIDPDSAEESLLFRRKRLYTWTLS